MSEERVELESVLSLSAAIAVSVAQFRTHACGRRGLSVIRRTRGCCRGCASFHRRRHRSAGKPERPAFQRKALSLHFRCPSRLSQMVEASAKTNVASKDNLEPLETPMFCSNALIPIGSERLTIERIFGAIEDEVFLRSEVCM